MHLAHHLIRIGTTYHFRIRVPLDLRTRYPSKYIKRSLNTGDPCIAKETAYILSATYKNQFRRLRGMSNEEERLRASHAWLDKVLPKPEEPKPEVDATQFDLDVLPNGQPYIKNTDPKIPHDFQDAKEALKLAQEAAKVVPVVQPLPTPVQQYRSEPAPPSKVLSEAIPWYGVKAKSSILAASLKKEITGQKEFLKFHKDCEVNTIDRHHLDNFRSHLQNHVGNSTPTIKNKFSALNKLFRELKKSGYYTKDNPAEGQITYSSKEKKRRRKKFGKLPFTPDDLTKIFDPITFTQLKKPSEFWCPLIQLYTGCRVNEACQLEVGDFTTVEDVPCISINDEGEDGSLKSEASRRTVPLHPNLVAIGLLDYVGAIKSKSFSNKRIFPYLKNNSNRFGDRQIKDFTAYLKSIGVDTKKGRVGTHSFRSTLIQKLQDHKISKEVRKDFVGHSNDDDYDDFTDSHSLNYSRLTKISEFTSIVIPALDFTINTQHLKTTPDRFFVFLSKHKKENT